MANIRKRFGKWQCQIRRTFHKPIIKTFASKQDAHKWARETERLIEVGQFVDLSEANKTTLNEKCLCIVMWRDKLNSEVKVVNDIK